MTDECRAACLCCMPCVPTESCRRSPVRRFWLCAPTSCSLSRARRQVHHRPGPCQSPSPTAPTTPPRAPRACVYRIRKRATRRGVVCRVHARSLRLSRVLCSLQGLHLHRTPIETDETRRPGRVFRVVHARAWKETPGGGPRRVQPRATVGAIGIGIARVAREPPGPVDRVTSLGVGRAASCVPTTNFIRHVKNRQNLLQSIKKHIISSWTP